MCGQVHTLCVMSLEPPIRQGQTVHNQLVMQFKTEDDEYEAKLKLEGRESKYVSLGSKSGVISGIADDIFSASVIDLPVLFRNRLRPRAC